MGVTAERRVEIPVGGIILEGVLSFPDGNAPFGAMVICHPHPQYGGSMHNNVVDALARSALESGLVALRFNFRGVGASGGSYGGGKGEQADVAAAITSLSSQPEIDPARVVLAGYSFGAAVAFQTGADIQAFIAVSLPTMMVGAVPDGARPPTLLISGDADEYSDPQRLVEIATNLGPAAEHQVLPGVDHFWWGAESQLETAVAAFIARSVRVANA
jgi:hypothetical protein